MTIKTDIRELIKNKGIKNPISKEEILNEIGEEFQTIEDILKHLLEDGEIFERSPNKFLWLGV